MKNWNLLSYDIISDNLLNFHSKIFYIYFIFKELILHKNMYSIQIFII